MSLIGLGGDGRGQLAPFSDIDLLFLTQNPISDPSAEAVEALLYVLWDSGFKVGQAVRSMRQCVTEANDDVRTLTAMIENRMICGDVALARRFDAKIGSMVKGGRSRKFTDDKIEERRRRYLQPGNSRYALEPHVKEGIGGLRDLHTLYWITRARFDDAGPEALHESELPPEILAEALPLKTLLPDGTQLGSATGELLPPKGDVGGRIRSPSKDGTAVPLPVGWQEMVDPADGCAHQP